MQKPIEYDVIIVGGGLAGLALSIQLARKKYRVMLVEKETYPFTKVCGEYISNESRAFVEELGIDLKLLQASAITKLHLSSETGKELRGSLPLGGFGISRYVLDAALATIAKNEGVELLEGQKVTDTSYNDDYFLVQVQDRHFTARQVAGCFGKRSNLDIKWQRPFILAGKNRLNNYIGIKYHVQLDFPEDTIALHNFKNGYCGIVKVEGNKYCVCYLTTAANLQHCNGQINEMERTIISSNHHLGSIMEQLRAANASPVTISQVSFDRKNQVEQQVLMVGDAAGMIAPLCGNGMSMALHASKMAFEYIDRFLSGHIGRAEMERAYTRQWRRQFGKRLLMGRWVQRLIRQPVLASMFISVIRPFPRVISWLVKRTHGKPFA